MTNKRYVDKEWPAGTNPDILDAIARYFGEDVADRVAEEIVKENAEKAQKEQQKLFLIKQKSSKSK